jgi:phosphatidylserine/phosphatidylglycerophosphate/cardiolipin synthase-like enzyme
VRHWLFLALLLFSVGFLSAYTLQPAFEPSASVTASGHGVFFCPEDACSEQVINHIDKARKHVYVAMYSFTLDSIADALIRARNRGVDVRVVVEESQLGRGSEYERLKKAGVDVMLDGNPALMHNKFAVIDGVVIITGSMNWSWSADNRNDENLVIIYSEQLARRYVEEFLEIWGA